MPGWVHLGQLIKVITEFTYLPACSAHLAQVVWLQPMMVPSYVWSLAPPCILEPAVILSWELVRGYAEAQAGPDGLNQHELWPDVSCGLFNKRKALTRLQILFMSLSASLRRWGRVPTSPHPRNMIISLPSHRWPVGTSGELYGGISRVPHPIESILSRFVGAIHKPTHLLSHFLHHPHQLSC